MTRRWLPIPEASGVDLQSYGERRHALIFNQSHGELEAQQPIPLGQLAHIEYGFGFFFLFLGGPVVLWAVQGTLPAIAAKFHIWAEN